MTLLSDVVRVLHDAEVPSYSVQASEGDLPGEPDLVVLTEGHTDQQAAEALFTSELSISSIRRVDAGVLHIWGAGLQPGTDGPAVDQRAGERSGR